MFSPVTHFLPVTTIRRARLLPVPGRVIARKGQKVNATDVIAEANLAPEHLLLDISRGLGLPPSKADVHINHRAGDAIEEGDIVAGPVGITKRVVRAPCAGRVVVAGSGQMLVEKETPPFELRAGIPGYVTELVPDRGAVIEATGALIQGVWGNGHLDVGVLSVQAESPQAELTPDRLDVSQRGLVIMGGFCNKADVLNNASEIPLRGLILASMDSSLVPLASRKNIPVIILEGFGNVPMNSAAYKLLSTNDRRDIVINAEIWDRYANVRPEIIIPLPATGSLPYPTEVEAFAPGQQVRILSAPYRGMIGTIQQLLPSRTGLKSGIRTLAANVRLESSESAVLPLANLEVLG